LIENGGVTHNFESGPPKDDFDRLCKLEKRGMKFKKKSSPRKLLSQYQPNFAEMILGWPLPNLCPLIPTSNQDGRQAKNRKKIILKVGHPKIISTQISEQKILM
jgi:hypothetical protein